MMYLLRLRILRASAFEWDFLLNFWCIYWRFSFGNLLSWSNFGWLWRNLFWKYLVKFVLVFIQMSIVQSAFNILSRFRFLYILFKGFLYGWLLNSKNRVAIIQRYLVQLCEFCFLSYRCICFFRWGCYVFGIFFCSWRINRRSHEWCLRFLKNAHFWTIWW